MRLRLGPYRSWLLFHPTHIEQVLAIQADKFIRFERMMNVLRQWNGESLFIAEGQNGMNAVGSFYTSANWNLLFHLVGWTISTNVQIKGEKFT